MKASWTDFVVQVSGVLRLQAPQNGNSACSAQKARKDLLLSLAAAAVVSRRTEPVRHSEPDLAGGDDLPRPADPHEWESFVCRQKGQASPRQRHYDTVANPKLFAAATARMVAYQIVACAGGLDPLEPAALREACARLDRMLRSTRLFVQAAALFLCGVCHTTGGFDLPKLRRFLGTRSLWELTERPGVGGQALPTLGAVASGLESQRFTLKDLVATRPMSDMDHFRETVEYVKASGFREDLEEYEDRG
ncbi:MAG: hypothetical protein HY319_26985 [Armatimonadetes bacterium]|nr:hypothetical protein [Armatimonadota bacterium]